MKTRTNLDEVEVFRHELLTVVHDEDSAHIQLHVVLGLAVLEEVERGMLRDEEQGAERKTTDKSESDRVVARHEQLTGTRAGLPC
jgi:hypothetical protein